MTGLLVADYRQPAVRAIAEYFAFDHLREGPMRDASRNVAEVAQSMVDNLPDSPELTVGLRKLLEAKDCFVRCALALP